MVRLGMVIDLAKCVGCEACTVACKAENATPPGIWYAPVLKTEIGEYPKTKTVFLPILCNHCGEAPCVKACPTKAISKRPDGIVVVDGNICSGHRACVSACPYGATHFYETIETYYPGATTPFEEITREKYRVETMQKCTLCAHRVDQGLEPACVVTCPTNCRIYGDLDNPNSKPSQILKDRKGYPLRPEAGTDPSVLYVL